MTYLASVNTKINVNINILQKSVQIINAETKNVRKDIPEDVDTKKNVDKKVLADTDIKIMIWKS